MPDPRLRGKVDYPLDEIRPLCLTAVLAGAETVAAIARFGWPDPYLPTTPTFIPMAVATHATKQADKNLRNNVATVFVGLKFSR
jgi:hypothetical protein